MVAKVRHFLRYLEHHAGGGSGRGRSPARPARLHMTKQSERRARATGAGKR
jgi:hypothetical protein